MNAVRGLFENLDKSVPIMPEVISDLMAVREGIPARRVLRILKREPEIIEAIMPLAQCRYYAGYRPFSSLNRLMGRVGLSAMRGLAMRSALDVLLYNDPAMPRLMGALRAHSNATAFTTQVISRYSMIPAEDAFHCALMQHIGVVVPAIAYQSAIGRAPDEGTLWQMIGCAHEAIAGLVASLWELPETIHKVLSSHHHIPPSTQEAPIIAALILAEHITDALHAGLDIPQHPPPDALAVEEAMDVLELPRQLLPRVIRESQGVLSLVA